MDIEVATLSVTKHYCSRLLRWVSCFVALALSTFATVTHAQPSVSGNTISWPDDGWYQVQNASTQENICNGGRSCEVLPGLSLIHI